MHRQLKIVSQKEQSNEDALKIIPGNDFNLNYVWRDRLNRPEQAIRERTYFPTMRALYDIGV